MTTSHSTPHRAIDAFLRREIDVGSFPSASYAIGNSSGITHEHALGHAVAVPLRIPASTTTIYDLASVTKVLVTTPLLLQAVAEGRLSLDEPIGRFLPELGEDKRVITARQLLAHTSGLKAWLPFYATGSSKADYLDILIREPVEAPPGTRVMYSDPNFVLLYLILQRIYGSYRERAQLALFDRLRIDAMFNPPPDMRFRIAATEWGQRFEAKLGNRIVPHARQGLMWGDANDGNSFHLGGTAGNAGLFGTARNVFRIAQAWSDDSIVPAALRQEATSLQTPPGYEPRGLGWQLRSDSVASRMLSPRAFGHTGFTGTSLWIDPERDLIVVLLTNRVHPCAAPIAMQTIRGRVNELALT